MKEGVKLTPPPVPPEKTNLKKPSLIRVKVWELSIVFFDFWQKTEIRVKDIVIQLLA